MDKTKDFTLSANQLFEQLSNVVSAKKIRDRWGDEISRFSLVDIQDNEVICIDRDNNYQYYGMPYSMNGDVATVDFDNAVRKKVVFENFEEGTSDVVEGAFNFADEITKITDNAFEKVESANSEKDKAESEYTQVKADYESIKGEYDEMKPKYDEYVSKEEARIKAETEAKKDECFAKFDGYLSEVTEYQALKDSRDDKTVEEIEQSCCVLYAKRDIAIKTEFSKNTKETDVTIMDTSLDNLVDDSFVQTKYGRIKKDK